MAWPDIYTFAGLGPGPGSHAQHVKIQYANDVQTPNGTIVIQSFHFHSLGYRFWETQHVKTVWEQYELHVNMIWFGTVTWLAYPFYIICTFWGSGPKSGPQITCESHHSWPLWYSSTQHVYFVIGCYPLSSELCILSYRLSGKFTWYVFWNTLDSSSATRCANTAG